MTQAGSGRGVGGPDRETPRMRRLLTIDGGGIKGVFPAALLAGLQEELDHPIADYFDLIAGTSTGGIIAIGLGLGHSPGEILQMYCDSASRIFPRRGMRALAGLFGARYANTRLRDVLSEILGDRRLGESRQRLVIPSLNLATEHVHLYKTSHHPILVNDYKELAVEVAMATVAAPSYFPIHISPDGVPHIDGSVWANNPLGLAVIEAIGILGWPRDEIAVLSLGCTSTPLNVSWQSRVSLGASYWAARISAVFMAAQSSSALVTARALLGPQNVYRISPDTSEHRYTIDGIKHIPSLRRLGYEEARRRLPELRQTFFMTPAEPFEPCHRLPAAGWMNEVARSDAAD
jgi:hypothetical protein